MPGVQELLSPYPPPGPQASAARAWPLMIRAVAEPGVLPRILEQLAKRSLVAEEIQCRKRASRTGARLAVRIVLVLDDGLMDHICRCWSGTPDVISVLRTARDRS